MADCKRKAPLLHDNPLCGISTYKDTLNLATGVCARIIGKYEFTGQENWARTNTGYFYAANAFSDYNHKLMSMISTIWTHYIAGNNSTNGSHLTNGYACLYCHATSAIASEVYIRDDTYTTLADFKVYLAAQYAAGTPVTVWYVLETPTTETITVPSGLSGTEEGYLNQSGTPTPTNPIYPTANNVEIWQHSLRKLGTSTDTITTLPVDIYADGNNATVGISGNTVQNGTPTPDNPVMPEGTGDMTGNLINLGSWSNQYSTDTRTYFSARFRVSGGNYKQLDIKSTGTYKLTLDNLTNETVELLHNGSARNILIFSYTANFAEPTNLTVSFTASGYDPTTINGINLSSIMLNLGSTALPYEPYGYKIPISSGSTTTPVYLGEVETTRKIKKLVLTGEEDITSTHLDVGLFNIPVAGYLRLLDEVTCICTHYIGADNVRGWSAVSDKTACFYAFTSASEIIYIRDSTYNTIDSFKAYLAAQYAAGTPVTVWYVLATEETAVVNEPLMKIGEYTDTVSDVTVPTITGKDTFDVETTLKPSEVSLSYTGWHDVSVKEWDGSQWNE